MAHGALVHLEQMAHHHWRMGLTFGVHDGQLWIRLSDQGDEDTEWEGDSREKPIPGVDE